MENKFQVLVVEDNLINQELLMEMLERLNCKVDVAKNGQDAIDYVDQKDYDLIFMDLQMPTMDGYRATAEIRNRNKNTPIIALSANTFSTNKKKCEEAGMNDYLSKPFELKDIESILVKFLPEK